jgi:hypothetical protein
MLVFGDTLPLPLLHSHALHARPPKTSTLRAFISELRWIEETGAKF